MDSEMNSTSLIKDAVFYKKDLTMPPTITEMIGVLVIMSITFLANAGGLGGGGLLTPFMLLFFDLSIQECVPLANVFGLIAALTRFIVNFNQKHPNPQKAIHGKLAIDYEIVTLTMAVLYLGTLLGVQIGTYLNAATLAISLGLVLGFMFYTTLQKALKNYKDENIQKQKELEKSQELKLIWCDSHQSEHKSPQIPLLSAELKEIYVEESKHFPKKRLINFLITLVILFTTSMFVGSKYQQQHLVSKEVVVITVIVFFIYTVVSTVYNAKQIRRIHVIKNRDGYYFDPKDLRFDNNKSLIKIIIICFIAGTMGGIVGIAGGIILGPLFLSLGMLPVVAAGTNQYLALISTISVTGQFLFIGILNLPYALALGLFQVIASYLGVTQANRVVKLTGRQSYISFTLALVLFLACVSLPLKYII